MLWRSVIRECENSWR